MRIVNVMTSKKNQLYGAQKAAIDYAVALSNLGHEVFFIVHDPLMINSYIKKNNNIKLIKVRKRLLWFVKERFVLLKIKPHAIIHHNHFSFHRYAAVGISQIIAVGHNTFIKTPKNFYKYDKIICFTEETKQMHVKDGIKNSKIFVIPNMVYPVIANKKSIKENKIPIIGYIGRLEPVKNIHTLVEAFKLLKDQNILFKAIIAGTGSQKAELESLVKRYKLSDRIEFPGYIKNAPDQFYSRIDLFCSLSYAEGFALTGLEAFSAKLPCLFSNIPCFSKLSNNGENALITNNKNPVDVKNDLEKILNNNELRNKMRENAYQYYLKNHTPSIIAKKLETMIGSDEL